jgi:AraC-like DNA-binding protein
VSVPPATPTVLEKSATTTDPVPGPGADGRGGAPATTSTRGILGDASLPFVLRRRAPVHPAVAERVERHWSTRWDLRGRDGHVQRILPHPCVNLVVHDGVVLVHGVPTGIDARPLRGRGCAIGTKFRPGAFAALSTIPAGALRDEPATLERAFGADGRTLEEQVLDLAPDEDAVWAAVEAFLLPRLPGCDPAFALVGAVAADMLGRSPDARIPDIARDHAVSPRTLQRAFRETVGVSPKWVLSRYRLHVAAERLAAGDDGDLARLALELGYADQAHFTGDFRATVGVTPSAYARACRDAAAG